MKILKKVLKELVEIKKELHDIKLILKFRFLSNYKTESEIIDGERFMARGILPEPLEALRKEEDTLQEHRNGEHDLIVHRQKLSRRNVVVKLFVRCMDDNYWIVVWRLSELSVFVHGASHRCAALSLTKLSFPIPGSQASQ